MMLEKYGVLTIVDKKSNKKHTRMVKRLIKQLNLIENIDYKVIKTTTNTSSGRKYKNEYLLSMDTFKL